MLPLKLTFNIDRLYYQGNPTGRLACQVGQKQFYATGKESLREQVMRFIDDATKQPEITIVQHEGEMRILTHHCGQTRVFKVVDGQLIILSTSQKALLTEANLVLQSLQSRFKKDV